MTACVFTIASAAQAAPAGGGTFAVSVTRTSGSCTWTASTDASWITFNGASSGSDSATLTYTAAANAGSTARTGTITVTWTGGSAQLVVTQAGTPAPAACVNVVAPAAQAVPQDGGAFSATVTMSGMAAPDRVCRCRGRDHQRIVGTASELSPTLEAHPMPRPHRHHIQWAAGS